MVAVVALATPLQARSDTPANDGWGYGHMMWDGGWGLGGGLMMILFWGIIIAAIVVAVRWAMTSQGGGSVGRSDALDRLRDRYAAGEIDDEEFERRKKMLEQ